MAKDGSTDSSRPDAGAERAAPLGADDRSDFVSKVAGAMKSVIDLERTRITNDIEARHRAYIDEIRNREAARVERAQAVAAGMFKAVEAWVEQESRRIELESKRGREQVEAKLESNLAAVRSESDAAAAAAEAAVASYRREVDGFFSRLDRLDEPVAIAQEVARRPVFPTLPVGAETGAPGPHEPRPRSAEKAALARHDAGSRSDRPRVVVTADHEPAVAASSDAEIGAEQVVSAVPHSDTIWPEASLTHPNADPPEHASRAGDVGQTAEGEGFGSSLLSKVSIVRSRTNWLHRSADDDGSDAPPSTDDGENCPDCWASQARGDERCSSCGRVFAQPTATSTQ
jgi:hypothetical protein